MVIRQIRHKVSFYTDFGYNSTLQTAIDSSCILAIAAIAIAIAISYIRINKLGDIYVLPKTPCFNDGLAAPQTPCMLQRSTTVHSPSPIDLVIVDRIE